VLDFSRIEQGRKQYEFEPTDLAAMVRETVKVMEPHAAEREVRLVTQLSTFGPQPSVDGRALQQALVNLIDNAIKHSPAGEVVTIGLERGDKSPTEKNADQPAHSKDAAVRPASGRDGFHSVPDLSKEDRDAVERVPTSNQQPSAATRIALYVEDHGPGIPPEEQEKIFERFYRLGSELRRETQGVGIGLSIVKHIVEAHGGRVVVRSDSGKGSRFTIELPMSDHPPDQP
jgi:signal transduction histidine kinase